MIRLILKILLGSVLLVVVAAAAVWGFLRPPVLPVPARRDLVFRNVTVVNPLVERTVARRVVVRGERIDSISADDGAPDGGEYAGAYLLPGLIDMHTHHPIDLGLGDLQLWELLFLAHGVTSVRDTGTFDGTILTTRRRIADGEFPGPRVFACGPVLDGDPPVWPFARVVRTPAEGETAVEELAASGVDCIKVYHDIAPEVLAAVRRSAERRRLPLIGHVPLRVPLTEVPVDDVQHFLGVAPLPATNVALADWLAAWQAVDDARIDAVVRLSVARRIAYTPTLVMWDRTARMVDYRLQSMDPTARLLPRWYRDVLWNYDGREFMLGNVSAARAPIFAAALTTMKSLLRRLHAAGVRTHVGSDAFLPFVVPGASLHEELRHFVEAGLSPEETWAEATRFAGQALGDDSLGTIAAGAPADFLLYRDDPSRDLAALATLEAVVVGGRLYSKAALDAALQRHRRYFEGTVYDSLSTAIADVAVRLLF